MRHCSRALVQVAYLMADISDVNDRVIKELYQRLESLSGNLLRTNRLSHPSTNIDQLA